MLKGVLNGVLKGGYSQQCDQDKSTVCSRVYSRVSSDSTVSLFDKASVQATTADSSLHPSAPNKKKQSNTVHLELHQHPHPTAIAINLCDDLDGSSS